MKITIEDWVFEEEENMKREITAEIQSSRRKCQN